MSNNLEKILHGYNETEEAIIKIIDKKTNTAAESVLAENLIPYPYYSRIRGAYGGVTSDVNPDGSISLNGLCTTTGVAFRIVYPDYNPIQLGMQVSDFQDSMAVLPLRGQLRQDHDAPDRKQRVHQSRV